MFDGISFTQIVTGFLYIIFAEFSNAPADLYSLIAISIV